MPGDGGVHGQRALGQLLAYLVQIAFRQGEADLERGVVFTTARMSSLSFTKLPSSMSAAPMRPSNG